MNDNNVITNIQLLDKKYQIACQEEQETDLQMAGKRLDKNMRQVRDNSKIIGLERIAVMAGLNLSYQLLEAEQKDTAAVEALALNITDKIDHALERLKNLDF